MAIRAKSHQCAYVANYGGGVSLYAIGDWSAFAYGYSDGCGWLIPSIRHYDRNMAIAVQVDIPYTQLQLGKEDTFLSPQGGGRWVANGCAVTRSHCPRGSIQIFKRIYCKP